MGEYSYKPARYNTGNMGRIRHASARKYALKHYNADLKIAQKHYDMLKSMRDKGTAAPKAQVPDIVPNPGNPLQFTNSEPSETQYVDMPLPAGLDRIDPVMRTHEMMAAFHKERAMAYMEAAMFHSDEMMPNIPESLNDKLPFEDPTKLPSLWGMIPEGAQHTMEAALDFHTTLHGDALLEALHYADVAQNIREKLDALPLDADPEKRNHFTEALKVCESLYNLYNRLSEQHAYYAGNFADYLKRRADHNFGYDSDNMRDNPPVASPDPNPWPSGNVIAGPDPV